MINIGLVGANGKMGNAIIAQIDNKCEHYALGCAVVSNKDLVSSYVKEMVPLYSEDINELTEVDVVVDFSTPKSSLLLLPFCVAHKLPVVIGTTGFSNEEQLFISECAENIAIVLAPNTSLSVNVLFKAVELLASKLNDFEVEIIEAHHRYKKDAPSGTALKIGDLISQIKGTKLNNVAQVNRCGSSKIRQHGEIGFSVIRGGDIVGMHEAQFISDGEILAIKSQITNRASFANGALLAASFVYKMPPGLYSMFDVLEL